MKTASVFFIVFLSFGSSFGQFEQKIIASDGDPGDAFGNSISGVQDQFIVGAINDDDGAQNAGAVYVYDWNGTNWIESKILQANPLAGGEFGSALAMVEDSFVVSNSNIFYLFTWNGSSWLEQEISSNISNSKNDIAIDEGRLLCRRQSTSNGMGGEIDIWEYDGINWNATTLFASDGHGGNTFGGDVAVYNDRIVVGANTDNENGNLSGAAYIYDWDGVNWNETKITASDATANAQYGYSVDIGQDRVVVGAKFASDMKGAAYIYDWDGMNWNETIATASNNSVSDFFGYDVALKEDKLIVAAPRYDFSLNNEGAIFLFEYESGNWVEKAVIGTSDRDFHDWFGHAVSWTGDYLIGTTINDDNLNGVDAGSVYLFDSAGTAVSFDTSMYSVVESNTTVDVCLSINLPSSVNATDVDVTLSNQSTATNGVDYQTISTTQTIQFPAGSSTNECFTITVSDDILLEGDETIIFDLTAISGGDFATIQGPSTTTVTLIGNDDLDGDGIENTVDNCAATFNPDQLDVDGDGVGNVCDMNNNVDELTEIENNLFLNSNYSGVIVKSSDGSCWIMTVNNYGELEVLPANCPN